MRGAIRGAMRGTRGVFKGAIKGFRRIRDARGVDDYIMVQTPQEKGVTR
jgi:hypothetical protein